MSTRSRKERGLCSNCSNPPRPGKTQCQACADKARARVLAKRAAGICQQTGCNNRVSKGSSRCEPCKQRHAAYERKYRKARDAAPSVCNQCGAQHKESTKLCADCKKHYLDIAHEKNFGGNRRHVLKRDNNTCALCNSNQKLIVHHRNGRASNNDMSNLITLCRRCHSDIHRLGNFDTRRVSSELVSYVKGEETNIRKRAKMTGWLGIRKKVLERDRNTCAICKKSQKTMLIHHKDDRGLMAKDPNHEPGNLITLCRACHNAITNQRNNANTELSTKLILTLGPGTLGTPKT